LILIFKRARYSCNFMVKKALMLMLYQHAFCNRKSGT